MAVQRCRKCEVEKPLSEFGKHNQLKSGRHTQCKQCRADYDKAKYQRNKTLYRERAT